MAAQYPFATLDFEDPELPLQISLEAHTPFVPLDVEASSLPIVVYRFSIANRTEHRQHGWLVGSLLNTVGWDGVTPIERNRCSLFGGNVNRAVGRLDQTAIVMDNPELEEADPAYGSLAIWTDAPARVLPRATSANDALRWVDSLKLLGPTIDGHWDDASLRRAVAASVETVRHPVGPSPAGSSWVGAIAAAFSVGAHETTEVRFVHAWWLPNRVVNFDQFGPQRAHPLPVWLGNAYAKGLSGAVDVIEAWRGRRSELEARSRDWASLWTDTTLPAAVATTLSDKPALVRSPSLFVAEDGTALAFEGGLGASTLNWNGDVGGSCPLNCTHVLNYEQALAALFPSLERTMRDVEWTQMLSPEGMLPHRLRVPIDGPQMQDGVIGGPLHPALDGMIGAILKTYREARLVGDRRWLEAHWDAMNRLVTYVTSTWDDGTGVLRGSQPVTFDVEVNGPNMFVGSMWLAALRTMEVVAAALERHEESASFGRRFAEASRNYDTELWNGEYYSHAATDPDHGFGEGCLSDQLIGQWWAHQLDLGYLLPVDHVRSALTAVVRHNLRRGFAGFEHGYRVFADRDDTGLLVCSWPRGGRPDLPLRYSDEVWSGSEYQVAAHCLFEGLEDEAGAILAGTQARKSGDRRNPFNEIECGDHYVRAMSGWSLLAASSGVRFDALSGTLSLTGRSGRWPFITGTAWGTLTTHAGSTSIEVRFGSLELRRVTVDGGDVVVEPGVIADGASLKFELPASEPASPAVVSA